VLATNATPADETGLYRIYGDAHLLLYIGISKNFGRRWHQHARRQPWWNERRHMTVDWYSTRDEALDAEALAIFAEQPIHNVMHRAQTRRLKAVQERQQAAAGTELVRLQEDARKLELSAATILSFEIAGIPSLLQIPHYTRRAFEREQASAGAGIAAALAVMEKRQATALYGGTKHVEFTLPELAIRGSLGSDPELRGQVFRIIDAATLDNVTVGIIPQDAEASMWHDHGFNVLEGPGDEAVVHVETLTRGLTITDPADVAVYKDTFSRLRKLAVTGVEAVEILRRIAAPRGVRVLPEPGHGAALAWGHVRPACRSAATRGPARP
jgi:hypothetical protein